MLTDPLMEFVLVTKTGVTQTMELHAVPTLVSVTIAVQMDVMDQPMQTVKNV